MRMLKVSLSLFMSLLVLFVPGIASATPDPQDLAQLVDAVADAQQDLADEQLRVGGEREQVNRAVAHAEQAAAGARHARGAARVAQAALAEADHSQARLQQRFDDFAGAFYMHGPFVGGLLGGDPSEALENAVQMQAISSSQRDTEAALEAAANTRRDEYRRADAAAVAAERAGVEAAGRRDEAVRLLLDSQRALEQRQRRLAELTAARDTAQARLAELGGADGPSPLPVGIELATTTAEPAVVIARMIAIAESSARETAELGRAFLKQLAVAVPVEVEATGSTYGRLPMSIGRQASELVIARALAQRGVDYSWGGGSAAGPTHGIDGGEHIVGFDCSGLILYAFAGVGIRLPHYSGSQYAMGTRVPVAQMRRGDVVFYGADGSQHVALYLGSNLMVEAPTAGDVVRVSPVRGSGMTPYAVRYIDF